MLPNVAEALYQMTDYKKDNHDLLTSIYMLGSSIKQYEINSKPSKLEYLKNYLSILFLDASVAFSR
jgi:hypothetical protein